MATRGKRASSPAAADPLKGKIRFDAGVIGSTGLRQWGGFIDEEFLNELKGAKGAKQFREMSDNDPIIGAVVYAITMLMRETPWSVTAVDETPAAADAKTFVEEVLDKMKTPLPDIIDEAASMFVYGYAPMEIVWAKRDDGNVGISTIQLRSQPTVYRWGIDPDDGSIDGLWQQPWSGPQVFIPIEKMLLFRTTVQRGNPEGRSILRNAYRSWRNKKMIEEIEGIGIERDLAGLPVARIPGRFFSADADADDQAVLAGYKAMVRNIRIDKQQGIVLPSDTDSKGKLLYDLQLLSSNGSRAINTNEIITRYDRQMATSVLADFIFLGQSSRGGSAGGSFALSSDKTALFSSAVAGFAKAMAAVFNRHLLPRLWALNAFDPVLMPFLKPSDLEDQNLQELGAFITALAGAGMALFPDRELENHLRSEAGLPEAPDAADGVDMATEEPPVAIAGPKAAMAVAEHATTLPQPEPAVQPGGAAPAAAAPAPAQSRQKPAGKGGRARAKSPKSQ